MTLHTNGDDPECLQAATSTWNMNDTYLYLRDPFRDGKNIGSVLVDSWSRNNRVPLPDKRPRKS